jgi:hypothetical protein
MNDSGFAMLQMEKSDDAYGKPYPFDFFPEKNASILKEALLKVIQEPRPSNLEGLYCDVKGNPVWLHHQIVPVNLKRAVEARRARSNCYLIDLLWLIG